ncbi:unnamed protein product [Effrenium voratum]|uniref:Uncharacterized protein n=1 Tax=Effrenium voratum TaxID=2562239 RepID=A0AA36I6S3_9DINO|nr:unnamed protein product [Effrenium voratum]
MRRNSASLGSCPMGAHRPDASIPRCACSRGSFRLSFCLVRQPTSAGALHEPHAGLGHASHALGRCLPGARGTTRISSSSSVSERCCPTSREHYSPPGLRRRCGSSSWCILVQNARREASFCCLLSDSEWNELLTGQPELPNEECFGLALRVDNGTAPLLLTHHPVQEPGLGEARSKCIFPLFQQEPLLWRPTRITWCEPPPERPISVAHAQLIPRLADSLRASWAFMTLAVQRGDAYSFPRFGARGHLGAHRRAAAAQDARAHGGNDHPEQDALARMSFAGRAFKFKLLW